MRRALPGPQAPAEREAVAVEQVVLEQHDVGALALHQLGAVVGAGGRADGHEAGLGAQQHREPGAGGRLGIHDGDARHAAKRLIGQ